MNHINSELVVYFDVDSTLIFETDSLDGRSKQVSYYNIPKWVRPHNRHIRFLKSLSARGYYVIVHSANGADWAKTIVEAFDLKSYVNQIMCKGIKYVDDLPCQEWMGAHIYLPENE